MKELYVSTLKSEQMLGEEFEELFMVKETKFSKSLSNKWTNLVLFDKTGEIPGIIFGEDAVNAEKLKGSIVKARGLVTLFNGECRATVKTVIPVDQNTVNLSDFVPGLTKEKLAELFGRLNNLLGQIASDAPLLCLVRSVYQKYGKDFMQLPGGYLHHRYAGGLLAHSVECAEMAALICDQQNGAFYENGSTVNRELVIAGALLHDIGKVFEFEVFPFGAKKENAPFLNYKVRATLMLTEIVKSIVKAYPDTADKWNVDLPILCNMALSCHKKNDEPPRTKEARIVMLADISSADTDACAFEESKVNQDNPEGGFFYSRYFGCNMKSSGKEAV
jgi:3'-5' exoribonuclease